MKRYKISWRVPVENFAREEDTRQLIDLMTEGASVGDEFWLFISEPTTNGYDPLENIARKCEMYKRPAAMLKARGMRVGINPWPTFGAEEPHQLDQGQPALPYPTMVGMDGKAAVRIACPVSDEFLEYTRKRYRLFAQTGCDFVWVDDDCRFTHLGGVQYPCFCERCVRGFENGRFSDRESLVSALNDPQNGALRRAWSAYNAERLARYCSVVRAVVDEVDPSIETPLMTVGYSHTTYDGDYIRRCMKALRAKSARPGHGFYWDETPMGMFDKAYEMSRQVVDMPDDVRGDIQYEEESCPCSPLNKAPATRLLEMGLSVWGGCTGVAMNHLYHAGGPRPFDYLRHEMSLLRRSRAFFDAYLDFAGDLPQSGLWGAYSAWAMSGMKVDERGWFRESDPAYNASRFVREWPCFGLPVTADPQSAWGTLLQGRMPDVFTDEELNAMFERPLFIDGEALTALWERGFGPRTGVRAVSSNVGGVEKLAPSPYAGDFAGSQRSGLFGLAYDLETVEEGVEPLAYTARPYGIPDRLSVCRYKNVVTMGYNPYQYTGTPGHMALMRGLFRDMGAPAYLEPEDVYDPPRVAAFVRARGNKMAALLINGQTDCARPFDLCYRGESRSAALLAIGREPVGLTLRRDGAFVRARIDGMDPWSMCLVTME
ncbi:MAG: hypothetical protein IJJ23_10670 [Clostridia bacterium]|nr:hypothetical protein [Clostridia bacterium]